MGSASFAEGTCSDLRKCLNHEVGSRALLGVDRRPGGEGTPAGGRTWGQPRATFPAVSQGRKELAMSVATQLGLADPDQELLKQARQA